MQHSYPNQLCSFCVVCFHSFSPTSVSRGGYWWRWTRNSHVGSPFFQIPQVYPLRVLHLVFAWLFQSSTEFILKRPNTLSQVGHNVKKGRVVNTTFKSFNTVATSPLALSWMPTMNGMCVKNNTIYTRRGQEILEWSRQVNSIVACCHSAKLCAHAARVFWSQQYYRKTNDRKVSVKKQVFALFC